MVAFKGSPQNERPRSTRQRVHDGGCSNQPDHGARVDAEGEIPARRASCSRPSLPRQRSPVPPNRVKAATSASPGPWGHIFAQCGSAFNRPKIVFDRQKIVESLTLF